MHYRFLPILALMVASICHGLHAADPVPNAGKWVIDSFDTSIKKNAGDMSVVVQENGVVHVGYYDEVAKCPIYARRSKGTWTRLELPLKGEVDSKMAMVVDSKGRPHFVFAHLTYFDLLHAWLDDNGTWQIGTAAEGEKIRLALSMAVDSKDQLHVAFFDQGPEDLRYAVRDTAGKWSVQTVSSEGTEGLYPSIVLDADEEPHILYEGDSTKGVAMKAGTLEVTGTSNLKYAYRKDGEWSINRVPTPGRIGDFKLWQSPQGQLYATMLVYDGLGLQVATLTDGAWTYAVVDTPAKEGALIGKHQAMSFDAKGEPVLLYQADSGAVRHATFGPDGWTKVDLHTHLGRRTGTAATAATRDEAGNVYAVVHRYKLDLSLLTLPAEPAGAVDAP